ncbi:hypothetical protein IPN35_05895 [Candidatus Peregrinibacteria bacterium]|nr:MAG: hypothetical protein IPN35_05895 [Candidatus Peregrinibacteria bacterium]
MKNRDYIKQRLSLECVFRYYGERVTFSEGFILCPFHYETIPSLHYDLIKKAFYCHGMGCEACGDIFNFIQLKEDCSLPEAINVAERILEEYETGKISSTKETGTQHGDVSKKTRKRVKKTKKIVGFLPNSLNAVRFMELLSSILEVFSLNEENKKLYLTGFAPIKITGFPYSKKIGKVVKTIEKYIPPNFSKETVAKYKIGYCGLNYKDALKKLRDQGFLDEELIFSGFFRREKRGFLYLAKHMQGRILYPFLRKGKVVQIAGRIAGNFRTPNKYSKTKHCRGMGQIFNADVLEKSQSILITEGVTDCIKANEVGIASVSPVAKDITRITVAELAQKLRGKNVAICFDSDLNGAGQKGAKLTQEKFKEYGIEAIIIKLPRETSKDKMDVCEFINTFGERAFKELLKEQGFDVFEKEA